MKKYLANFIVTVALAMIFSKFLPWWSIMLAAFITGYLFSLKRSAVFIVPFLAIGLLWSAQAFYIGNSNDFILGEKIAQLLPLNGSVSLLIIITGLIGGIAAGVAGIFGKQCNDL